ncbi:MAG: TonB family protein [Elusimicrobia bacterium]|nr:TonB family protein [Elusimicrobiota bacterium]
MLEETDNRLRDLPFFVTACIIHGLLLSKNPSLGWGGFAPKLAAPLPIEFVQGLPKSTLGMVRSPAPLGPAPSSGRDPSAARAPRPKVLHPHSLASAKPRRRVVTAVRPRPAAAKRAAVPRASLESDLFREQARIRRTLAKFSPASSRAALPKSFSAQAALADALGSIRPDARTLNDEARRLSAHRQALIREGEDAVRRSVSLEQKRGVRALQAADIDRQIASGPEPDENIEALGSGSAAPEVAGPGLGGGAEAEEVEDAVYDSPTGGVSSAAGGGGPGGIGSGNGPISWSLSGPAGNRRLLKRILPACPEWVSRRGLDLTVQLKFRVLEDGSVKGGVLILRTSGFPALDRIAIDAIRQWRFNGVGSEKDATETWGAVKFRFLAQ